MKMIKTAAAGLILAFALAVPGMANASGEVADASFSLTPKQGQFQKNTLLPAKWSVETTVATADPIILPMKIADLKFPQGQMTFNPSANMPVCADSDVGPAPTNMSVTVPVIVARCPQSVLGNGLAKFVLGRNNLNPIAVLDGVMVVFNGGLKGGRPLIKVYAYSYDTGVGIYTEAALQADGSLVFNIPILTSDSAVSQLNLAIPSKKTTLTNWGPGAETVVLPAGQDANYVKGRCATGSWPFEAAFTLGTRDISGNPTSPDSIISDSGATPCTAGKPVVRRARIGSVRLLGPGSARRGRTAVYRVVVKNTGKATAKGVRVRLSGRGVRVNAAVGNIAAGRSKTVRTRLKFRSKGRIKMTAKVTSRNAGSRSARKVVRVR